MFQASRWKRLAPLALFFAGYSLLFYLWVKTFLYTLPFLAGFLIALAIQPLAGFFQERLRIPRGGAALAATTLAWLRFAAAWPYWACWLCGSSPLS